MIFFCTRIPCVLLLSVWEAMRSGKLYYATLMLPPFFWVISTNIYQRSCWKLNWGSHDRSEETLTTSQTGSWQENFPFTVSVLFSLFLSQTTLASIPKKTKKKCFSFEKKKKKSTMVSRHIPTCLSQGKKHTYLRGGGNHYHLPSFVLFEAPPAFSIGNQSSLEI